MKRLGVLIVCLPIWALAPARAGAAPVRVASPEAVFLDVARQIGGPQVVTEFVKRSARGVERPAILIDEGADDGWEPGARERLRPDAIVAARALASASIGEGPSWYDLPSMEAVGEAVAKAIVRAAPGEASGIETRRDAFLRAVAVLKLKSREIVDGYGGTLVLVTDPRFGAFCRSLGLVPVPAVGDAAAKSAIASRKGIVLIYDAEAPAGLGPLKALAEDGGLPIVGLRMTLPSGLSYQQWIGREINLIHGALNEAAP